MMSKLAVGMACFLLMLGATGCETRMTNPGGPSALGDAAAPADTLLAANAKSVVTTEPVMRLSDSAEVGTSRLVRTPNGINFSLSTTDLTPGHAYTFWFVAFNEPAGCIVMNLCGPDDVVNADAKPDMMFAAGRIAGGAGTPSFSGRMNVGDTSGSINAPVGLPSYGLMDPFGAQILVAVHDHGPKLPDYMPDMIQTIDGGCTDAGVPEAGAMSPWNAHPFGRRGPNTCMTIQAAIHRP